MSRYIDIDKVLKELHLNHKDVIYIDKRDTAKRIEKIQGIDIVRCKDCRKSHIDGKTTHYLWCTEWGRSTDVFGYCERGKREGE